MKISSNLAIVLLTGCAVGAAAVVKGAHALAKPPAFAASDICTMPKQ